MMESNIAYAMELIAFALGAFLLIYSCQPTEQKLIRGFCQTISWFIMAAALFLGIRTTYYVEERQVRQDMRQQMQMDGMKGQRRPREFQREMKENFEFQPKNPTQQPKPESEPSNSSAPNSVI